MKQVAFKQVDVFTSIPFLGNPLAVVFDADGLGDTHMQQIARWTNLSETTFVLPPTRPGADYRLRIFTTARELPFAGHPSIGTAHALLESGRLQPRDGAWIQECAAGLLPMRVTETGNDARRIFVRVPKARLAMPETQLDRRTEVALGFPPHSLKQVRVVDVGAVWLVADLGEAAQVRGLQPLGNALQSLTDAVGVTGITVFGRDRNANIALTVRSFCPGEGMFEDPVCGSGNAAVAAFLHANDQLGQIGTQYCASQGREVGRDGVVEVRVADDGAIEIGGAVVTCVDGVVNLP